MTTKPKPSRSLGAAGGALWASVVGKYELRPDELAVLEDACAERDLIARLSDALSDSDLVVRGSMGQDVLNPLASEVRQHRTACASLLAKLRLPDESGSESSGEVSARNRAAANARWGSRGA